MQRNIVLLGFMGTGKTVVGQILAQRLQRPFIDVDQLLEAQVGVSIAEFFASEGEASFRGLEKKAIQALAAKGSLVLATGGGVVLDPVNVAVLRQNGFLILLTANPKTIAKRLAGDQSRPLLGPDMDIPKLEGLLREREAAYRAAADFRIATDDLTPGEVAGKIAKALPGFVD